MNNTLELPKMTHENESRPKANHGDLKKLNSDNGIWLPISYGLRGYRGKSLRFRTNDWIKKKGFIFPDGFFLIPQRNQPSFKLIDPNLLNSFEFNLKKTLSWYTLYTQREIFSIIATAQYHEKEHPLWKIMEKEKNGRYTQQKHIIFLSEDDDKKVLVYKFSIGGLDQLMVDVYYLDTMEFCNIDSIIISNGDSSAFKKFSEAKRQNKRNLIQEMLRFISENFK
jgi:hypothetical protein